MPLSRTSCQSLPTSAESGTFLTGTPFPLTLDADPPRAVYRILMRIVFASRRLERSYLDVSRAVREWGRPVGLRYIQRIKVLAAANNLHELRQSRALRLHPLRGDRDGEWAMTLHGRWRMIIQLADQQTVIVKEVSAHYGD